VRVLIATEPGNPDRDNEDWATATPDMLVVLDGATARIDTGCIHGIAWYANKLGGAIVAEAADHHRSLRDVLATAIRDVAAMHRQCDLAHPGTPSAAVGILRRRKGILDLLALADVTIVLRKSHGNVVAMTDDRVDKVAVEERRQALSLDPGDPARELAMNAMKRAQLAVRNRPGGFFVAAADPGVADHAFVDSLQLSDLTEAAILSDGAAIGVRKMGLMTWEELMRCLAGSGPESLIRKVREAERTDPTLHRWPRTKASDDATVAYVQF
jgi:hypothetical protein